MDAAIYPQEYSGTDERSFNIHVNCSQTEYLSGVLLHISLLQGDQYIKNDSVLCKSNSLKDIYIQLNCAVPYKLKLFWISQSNISQGNECVFEEIEDEVDCPNPTGIYSF